MTGFTTTSRPRRRSSGTDLRDELEHGIYERFAALGRQLETRYRELQRPGTAAAGDPTNEQRDTIEQELRALGKRIYALIELMLDQIRREDVGRRAPASRTASAA